MNFRTALAVDLKREYRKIFRGVAALPPVVSQIPGKYLSFLAKRGDGKAASGP